MNVDRELAFFFVAVFATVLISTVVLCMVEVSSRISALKFVQFGTNQIQERIARRAENTTTEDLIQPLQHEVQRLAVLRTISDELDFLNFSGANDWRNTVVAIRHRLDSGIREIERDSAIRQLEERMGVFRAELRLLTANLLLRVDFIDRLLAETTSGSSILRRQLQSTNLDLEGGADTLFDPQGDVYDLQLSSIEVEDLIVQPASMLIDEYESEERSSIIESFASTSSPILNESFFVRLNYQYYLATDFLIAIVVVMSGVIGAIASATRRQSVSYSVSVVSGLLAGFIALLIVNGGGSLLYVSGNVGEVQIVNPYALAFAGVLAGLFTERAFELLSSLVDELAERVKGDQRESLGGHPEFSRRRSTENGQAVETKDAEGEDSTEEDLSITQADQHASQKPVAAQ